jgi:hypothetical protein
MRTVTRALALIAAPVLLGTPGAALACSVEADYRVPTNLELAADANAIVLGQVVGGTLYEGGDLPGEWAIEVRPLAAIKGLLPGEALVLPDMLLDPSETFGETSDPLDFGNSHPDGGACIRRHFPAGATVLFFLARRDGGWAPAGGALSRWAEDVSGPDDPWAQLTTLYVHAARLSPDEREALLRDQLEALQARIAAGTADEVALAMATDIEHAIAAPGFPLLPERPPEPAFDLKAEIAAEQAEAMEEMLDEEMGLAEEPDEPDEPVDLGELGERIDAMARDRQD